MPMEPIVADIYHGDVVTSFEAAYDARIKGHYT